MKDKRDKGGKRQMKDRRPQRGMKCNRDETRRDKDNDKDKGEARQER